MARKIKTRAGVFVIYHKHETTGVWADEPGGPFFFAPEGYDGEVFSRGYRTRDAAIRAAKRFAEEEYYRSQNA